MGEIKVAYDFPISDEYLAKLQATSPDVRLVNLIDAAREDATQTEKHGESSSEAQRARAAVDAELKDAQVLYTADPPTGLVQRAPNLKWLQYVWDGIDLGVGPDILESPIVVTNARQLGALCIAEWVLLAMLMFSKKALDFMQDWRDKDWRKSNGDFYYLWELKGKTVGVVGLGAIGDDVARLSKAFGMRVLATRRSATKRQTSVGNVDQLYPASELDEVLKQSDFVVLCVPLTKETEKLIGERELKLMSKDAYIINIARGQVIDEPVLAKALREGWIAGAGLDVFEVEPLSSDSELYDLPNVIGAHHITGDVDVYNDRIAALFAQNLERYVKGEDFINLVNKELGY